MQDAVARLTPLGVVVLELLREDDMHPYEMIRLMRQRRDDRLVSLTNGTMYHTVARLLRAGLIAEVGTDRDGNRPERTTYTLPPAGRDAALAWVRHELVRLDRPAQYRVALAEAHGLDRAEVEVLLRRRCAALAEAEERLRDGRATAREHGIPDQYLIEHERTHVLLEAERRWTEALVERLVSGALPWGDGVHPPTDRYRAQREAARR